MVAGVAVVDLFFSCSARGLRGIDLFGVFTCVAVIAAVVLTAVRGVLKGNGNGRTMIGSGVIAADAVRAASMMARLMELRCSFARRFGILLSFLTTALFDCSEGGCGGAVTSVCIASRDEEADDDDDDDEDDGNTATAVAAVVTVGVKGVNEAADVPLRLRGCRFGDRLNTSHER